MLSRESFKHLNISSLCWKHLCTTLVIHKILAMDAMHASEHMLCLQRERFMWEWNGCVKCDCIVRVYCNWIVDLMFMTKMHCIIALNIVFVQEILTLWNVYLSTGNRFDLDHVNSMQFHCELHAAICYISDFFYSRHEINKDAILMQIHSFNRKIPKIKEIWACGCRIIAEIKLTENSNASKPKRQKANRLHE